MHLIHCTQKLLKELSVPTVDPAEYPDSGEGIGNWYANLFRVERRKCLLFTNEKTLYSFIIPKVVKKDLERIGELFLSNLNYNFQFEEFPVESIANDYGEIKFAKTASRIVLGSMNELRFTYEYEVYRYGGIDKLNPLETNHFLNGLIMGALKYKYPVKAMRELLQSRYEG